jgi:hypothetical protein
MEVVHTANRVGRDLVTLELAWLHPSRSNRRAAARIDLDRDYPCDTTDLGHVLNAITCEAARVEEGRGTWAEAEWHEWSARLDQALATATPDELARIDFDGQIASNLRHWRLSRARRTRDRIVVTLAQLRRRVASSNLVRTLRRRRAASRHDVAATSPAEVAHTIERRGPPALLHEHPLPLFDGSAAA